MFAEGTRHYVRQQKNVHKVSKQNCKNYFQPQIQTIKKYFVRLFNETVANQRVLHVNELVLHVKAVVYM